MKDNIDIEKLFKDKFESFEPSVSAEVWQGIASGISASGTAAAGGIGGAAIWLKGAAISAVAATVVIGAYLYTTSDDQTAKVEIVKIEDQAVESVPEVFDGSETSDEGTALLSKTQEESSNIGTKEKINSSQSPLVNDKAEESPVVSISSVKKTEDLSEVQPIVSDVEMTEDSEQVDIKSIDSDAVNGENKSSGLAETKTVGGDIVEDIVIKQKSTMEVRQAIDSEKPELLNTDFVEESENLSFIKEIPNVFTPSNDGANDVYFIPKQNMQNLESFYIVIFSRNNIKLFESEDQNFAWDGYDFSDNKVEKGVCYYLIKAVGLDGQTYSKKGQINLY